MIASAAGVIGGRFIVSGDYEYRPYQSVNVKDNNGNEYKDMTQDVKDYYKASNIVRLGAEFRVTPSFSVRAGYSYESSPVTDKMNNNQLQVYTSGPDDTEVTPPTRLITRPSISPVVSATVIRDFMLTPLMCTNTASQLSTATAQLTVMARTPTLLSPMSLIITTRL